MHSPVVERIRTLISDATVPAHPTFFGRLLPETSGSAVGWATRSTVGAPAETTSRAIAARLWDDLRDAGVSDEFRSAALRIAIVQQANDYQHHIGTRLTTFARDAPHVDQIEPGHDPAAFWRNLVVGTRRVDGRVPGTEEAAGYAQAVSTLIAPAFARFGSNARPLATLLATAVNMQLVRRSAATSVSRIRAPILRAIEAGRVSETALLLRGASQQHPKWFSDAARAVLDRLQIPTDPCGGTTPLVGQITSAPPRIGFDPTTFEQGAARARAEGVAGTLYVTKLGTQAVFVEGIDDNAPYQIRTPSEFVTKNRTVRAPMLRVATWTIAGDQARYRSFGSLAPTEFWRRIADQEAANHLVPWTKKDPGWGRATTEFRIPNKAARLADALRNERDSHHPDRMTAEHTPEHAPARVGVDRGSAAGVAELDALAAAVANHRMATPDRIAPIRAPAPEAGEEAPSPDVTVRAPGRPSPQGSSINLG
jgi:hypothetical protein